MADKRYYLAFDLGATSGRSILGCLDGGRLVTEELTRFPNAMIRVGGHLYWNIYSLFDHIKDGLKAVARRGVVPESVGIDTWGVDFACVSEDGSIIGLPVAYRDMSLDGAAARFFAGVMPAAELYRRTGIQHLDFNSIFRFNELKSSFAMKHASRVLFLPDALSYMLTGNAVMEYTIASTGAILDPVRREVDRDLVMKAGISPDLLGTPVEAGTVIGHLSGDVARETGLPQLPVVAVAGHDTASAVAAVPAVNGDFAYLSSGTWSLMGIESPVPVIDSVTERYNITNEGGVDGTVRVLRNITGMWVLEQCLKVWKEAGTDYSYADVVRLAAGAEPFKCFIDTDDREFACPENMPEAIDRYCARTGQPAPASHGDYIRAVFESLAMKYRYYFDIFRQISPHPVEVLHVIGGGSRNALLNQFTANAICRPVVAGPAEASALGNILMQAKATGAIASLDELREVVACSTEPVRYEPESGDEWSREFERYKKITNLT
ncbi:MAG: rhamnulokinase [Muribaculaceae bacterium]|nr:rhamnulokinase [Muribaculaceae bacterium]